ncbi:hypothetical protein GCM10029992_28710 [Glycomyces albus]
MPSSAPTPLNGRALTNWAGNVVFTPDRFERPATLEEAQEVVASAERVRVLGSGHSFNAIADSASVMLSLADIDPFVEIDAEAGTVRAAGWITYAALSSAVAEAGYALHNLASLPHISVAGSIATGTHGSGDRNGNLATAVAALEFIDPGGRIRTVRRGDEDFPGSVVHLGALGPVAAVTLDLLPSFEMRQYVYDDMDFDRAVDGLDELTASAYSTSLFTPWGRGRGSSSGPSSAWTSRRSRSRPPSGWARRWPPVRGTRSQGSTRPLARCSRAGPVPGTSGCRTSSSSSPRVWARSSSRSTWSTARRRRRRCGRCGRSRTRSGRRSRSARCGRWPPTSCG